MSDQEQQPDTTVDQPDATQQETQQADAPEQETGQDTTGQQPEQDGAKPDENANEPDEAQKFEKESKKLVRRIDKLTRSKYQDQAKIQALEAELERYREPESTGEPKKPDPADMREQARQMVEMERVDAKCEDLVAKGEKAHTDFAEKVREVGQELPLFDAQNRPEPILMSILEADDPAELLYHLGQNPDLAAEIADLSPRQQMRRLIQIEASMGKTDPATAPKKPSKAPPPATPNRASSGAVEKDPEKMTDEEWWASQRKTKG